MAAVASTDAATPNLSGFGRCLWQSGAVFYGASWCPHCRSQREALGNAWDHVRYVECSDPSDPDHPAAACRSANVYSYPTWIFRDGSRSSGELSLAELASKTGCTLPSEAGSPTDRLRGSDPEAGVRKM